MWEAESLVRDCTWLFSVSFGSHTKLGVSPGIWKHHPSSILLYLLFPGVYLQIDSKIFADRSKYFSFDYWTFDFLD